MMSFKLLLILGCLVIQGFSKPVDQGTQTELEVESEEQSEEESEENEPDEVVMGVASVVEVIDELLSKVDDIKTSEIRDLAGRLVQEVAEIDSVVDTLILQISKGNYFGRRVPDVVIKRPRGSAKVRLEKEDEFLAALFRSLTNFKKAMVTIAGKFEADGKERQAIKHLRILKQVLWGTRQVGLTLLRIAANAEEDAEEALKEDMEETLLDPRRDLDITDKQKTLKKRNWGWKLDGLHWNRGNHHFQVGPTFGQGGFGGQATYTWRFQ